MKQSYPINEISQCIRQAQALANRIQDIRHNDKPLCRAFISLAGDQVTGFLAFAIWRGRLNMVSFIQYASHRGPGIQNPPGASLAQT